eukprot:GHVU01140625.1.p1 GENE.GHVU01140625.1~~GHVU01140625.1.p1  ORF type:complete len:240 (+),score=41.55 GHVU01140625.1:57-776(+)
MANINPSPKDVADKVPALREKFQDKYKDKIAKGSFDQRDIDRLMSDDAYARCFLRTLKAKSDVSKACDVIETCFKFRKEIGIWDLTDESFPERLKSKRDAMYYKGVDHDGFPILYINIKENNVSGAEDTEWQKRFIALRFEEHHRKNPEQMCVVIMDMSGATTGNVNVDSFKFIVTCFTTYFPAFLAYSLNYEMPGLLSGFWKIVSAFLNKEQNEKLRQVKKKDIGNFIPAEHLWDHMK